MFDFVDKTSAPTDDQRRIASNPIGGSPVFWATKRGFDILFSIFLLPVLGLTALVLLLLNPWLNKGSLFFIQSRMGKDCQAFNAIKFRSMTHIATIERGPDDPIEQNRITTLGRVIRNFRLDELPQVLNVLRGEMSLIGPRPDYFAHASEFTKTIAGYRERHSIRPGISGLAQVHLGYVEGSDATIAKVQKDLEYIENAGFLMDVRLVVKTVSTVVTHAGA